MLFSKIPAPRKAILLTQLGTPDELTRKSVQRYVEELLRDQAPIPAFLTKIYSYFRAKTALSRYQKVWTPEGSPLMVHTKRLAEKLLEFLPNDTAVALAMRYQSPSIKSVLSTLSSLNLDEITIVPLFPQQAKPVSRSLIDALFSQIKTWEIIPRLTYVPSFFQESAFIQAIQNQLAHVDVDQYDHILFSFHSIFSRDISCQSHDEQEFCSCYRCQCLTTTRSVAEAINLTEDRYTMVFQSSLNLGSWVGPDINDIAKNLIMAGKKRVLVLCPGFVTDCVETLGDIDHDFKRYFLHHGGERLDRIECLNDSDYWVSRFASFLSQKG